MTPCEIEHSVRRSCAFTKENNAVEGIYLEDSDKAEEIVVILMVETYYRIHEAYFEEGEAASRKLFKNMEEVAKQIDAERIYDNCLEEWREGRKWREERMIPGVVIFDLEDIEPSKLSLLGSIKKGLKALVRVLTQR